MHYSASVKLKPGSQPLRAFLRQNKFTIYRVNFAGISADNDVDDPNNIPYHYKGFYNGDEPLSQAVVERLNEEFAKGLVLKYQITKTQ